MCWPFGEKAKSSIVPSSAPWAGQLRCWHFRDFLSILHDGIKQFGKDISLSSDNIFLQHVAGKRVVYFHNGPVLQLEVSRGPLGSQSFEKKDSFETSSRSKRK